MPNEFKVKNGLIVDQGRATITGSLIVSSSTNGIDTVYGTLTTNLVNKVDWQSGVLATSVGSNSVDWENRALTTVNGSTAFEYATTVDDYVSTNLYLTQLNLTPTQRALTEGIVYSGHVIQGTIDVGVTPYQIMYLDTDGTWKALKNIPIVSTKMLGIEVAGNVLLEGDMTVSDNGFLGTYVVSASYGLPVYLSETTGVLTTVQPTTDIIRVVGHIYYQNPVNTYAWIMKFRPSNDWTQI